MKKKGRLKTGGTQKKEPSKFTKDQKVKLNT